MMFAALAGNETRNGFSAFIMAVSTKPAHIPVTLMWARRVRARTLRPSRYEDTSALDAQCDAAPPLARSINMLAMKEHPGCRGELRRSGSMARRACCRRSGGAYCFFLPGFAPPRLGTLRIALALGFSLSSNQLPRWIRPLPAASLGFFGFFGFLTI